MIIITRHMMMMSRYTFAAVSHTHIISITIDNNCCSCVLSFKTEATDLSCFHQHRHLPPHPSFLLLRVARNQDKIYLNQHPFRSLLIVDPPVLDAHISSSQLSVMITTTDSDTIIRHDDDSCKKILIHILFCFFLCVAAAVTCNMLLHFVHLILVYLSLTSHHHDLLS